MSLVEKSELPRMSVVLAMSADGKISDVARTAARFPSPQDKRHLETCLAQADATLFGASTLRAYETTLTITNPQLLQQRHQRGQPPQPIHIVCSGSGALGATWRFFSQPVQRWLLTTPRGAQPWQAQPGFDKILPLLAPDVDWLRVARQLQSMGLRRIVVMGGGELVAALVAADLVEDFWLTLCPLLIGGRTAPTPLDGQGFWATQSPRLQLLSVKTEGDEVFLHYQRLPHSIDSKIQLP
jgi:5-amino-6-(5-phosphoribosylamino)uracil reductase